MWRKKPRKNPSRTATGGENRRTADPSHQQTGEARLSEFRERRFDPRKHRCLSELGTDPLRLGQMLYGECAFLLGFVKQAENHLRAANKIPCGIEMRIFQDARR